MRQRSTSGASARVRGRSGSQGRGLQRYIIDTTKSIIPNEDGTREDLKITDASIDTGFKRMGTNNQSFCKCQFFE